MKKIGLILLVLTFNLFALPDWTSWHSKSQSSYTIKFRMLGMVINNMQVPFEINFTAPGSSLANAESYTLDFYEDDLVDSKIYTTNSISVTASDKLNGINRTFSGRAVTSETGGGSIEEYYLKITIVMSGIIPNVTFQTTNLQVPIYTDDTYEPNNSFTDATYMGNGSYSGTNIIVNDNDDFYRFVVPSSANNWNYKVELKTSYFSAGGNLDLFLYNSSQTLIGNSQTSNNNELIQGVLSSGTYYIRVGRNGSPVRNWYDLFMSQSAPDYLDVLPSSLNVPASSGSTTFDISSNISWSITDNADWVSITPTSGSGSRQISVNYSTNLNTTTRKCTVTVTGGSFTKTVIVNQAGATPILEVTPPNRDVAHNDVSTTFNVHSNTTWTASDNVSWASVTVNPGSGDGTVNVSFTQNASTSPRTVTITVAGGGLTRTVYVNQAGAPVTLEVTPSQRNVDYQGSSTTFTVNSNTSWTTSDNTSWVSVSPVSSSGNQTITATYGTNPNTTARTCSITVAGGGLTRVVAINQNGAPEALSITPSNRDVPYTAGNTTFDISSNISWNLSDNADWVTLSPTQGSGNTTITANYSANTTTSPRVCSITVTGGSLSYAVTVSQAAAPPEITINTSSLNLLYSGGTTTFSLSANVNWSISANVTWLRVNPSSGGPGSHTINVSYDPNPTIEPRSVIVTITGGGITKTISGTQPGAPVSLTVTPPFRDVPAAGGQTTFDVVSNVSWTVTDNAVWANVTPVAGSNNAQLTVTCDANPTITARVCSVSVTGGGITRTVAVNQPGNNPTLTVTPLYRDVPYTASNTTFNIASNTSWTATESCDWLSITGSPGSGNGTLNVSVQANALNVARTCTITISGGGNNIPVTVNQAAAPTVLTVTPSNRDVQYAAGSTTFEIISNSNWVVSDNVDWVTITPGSGSLNGTLTTNFTANTSTASRVCSVTVAGGGISRVVTITQAGAPVQLMVSPEISNVTFNAGTTSIDIVSNTTWSVSDNAGWVTITPESGSGNRTITADYTSNTSTVSRVCSVTVAGGGMTRVVTITQAAAPVNLSVTPNNRPVSAAAGNTAFDIVSNASWTITESEEWVTLSQQTGTGNASFTANYSANTSVVARTCSITVSTGGLQQVVTISQAGDVARFVSTPDTNFISHSAGQAIFNISSNTSWSVSTTSDWITSITPQNHSGDGQLIVGYSSNTTSSSRICSLRVEYGTAVHYLFLVQAFTSVREYGNGIPETFNLSQNYPNPFNPTTIVRFAIPKESTVKIELFSSQGELVNVIESSDKKPGYYEVDLNMSNLASGIYLYRITAVPMDSSDPYIQTKKFVLMK